MTLERFLEIINNKEYEKLEYVNSLKFLDNCIDIHTRNGAFIRFRFDCHTKGFFHMTSTPYFDVLFFVPEENIAVSNYRITEGEPMYETLKELFVLLKSEVKKEQANKYF